MLQGLMPPTGSSGVPGGRIERSAVTAAGLIISAGNSFNPWAPAPSAAKASVGVTTPGKVSIPDSTACAITRTSQCGDTISWPPTLRTASTSSRRSTVPAPIKASSGAIARMAAIASSAPGRFSGTSSKRKPVANRIRATGVASATLMPRRIATIGNG